MELTPGKQTHLVINIAAEEFEYCERLSDAELRAAEILRTDGSAYIISVSQFSVHVSEAKQRGVVITDVKIPKVILGRDAEQNGGGG